jgi:uncharacterized membrane protein
MARVEKSIEVDVPVSVAYNQWTQFEEFPKFMDGVERIEQLDDRRLHWKAKVGGKTKEWDAVIQEQVPDEMVSWRAATGPENAGVVRFDSLAPTRTRVHLEMSYDPEGMLETVGDKLGFMGRTVDGDLQRFRDFIESRQMATGAYREELDNPTAPGGHTAGAPARDHMDDSGERVG